MEALTSVLDQYRLQLVSLSETRITGSDETHCGDYTILNSGGTQRHRGVALVPHKSIRGSMTSWQPVSDRYYRLACLTYTAISPLLVSMRRLRTYKDNFYNQLAAFISATSPHDQLVVLDDFNASSASGQACFESVVGPYGVEDVNDNTQRFQTMCSSRSLAILGSWFKHIEIHCHIWLSNDSYIKKEIDHIITNTRTMFKSYRVFRDTELPANADH